MAASLDLLLARPLVFGPLLALFAALLVAFIRKARAHPINDICTDPSAPLEFVKARLAYHPKFAQIQKRLYPSMQPLELPQGDARTWPVFLAACRALAEVRFFTKGNLCTTV